MLILESLLAYLLTGYLTFIGWVQVCPIQKGNFYSRQGDRTGWFVTAFDERKLKSKVGSYLPGMKASLALFLALSLWPVLWSAWSFLGFFRSIGFLFSTGCKALLYPWTKIIHPSAKPQPKPPSGLLPSTGNSLLEDKYLKEAHEEVETICSSLNVKIAKCEEQNQNHDRRDLGEVRHIHIPSQNYHNMKFIKIRNG